MTPETRQRRILVGAAVLALAVIGFAVRALAGDSVGLEAVGYGLVGVAGVAAVSAVFYEIGSGEDDERREAESRLTPEDQLGDPSPPPRLHRAPPSRRRRGAR